MTALQWDQVGERLYETGVDQGVLYIPDGSGAYTTGVAWNGLTTVTETPSGADSNPQFADNIKYLNLLSAEDFGGTIEAYTYPDEFAQCDGTAIPYAGVSIGQQSRKSFGLCYRTRLGNDIDGVDHGYKIHIVYGAQASPSERAYATINDSPEALSFSWDFTTTPVAVGTINSVAYKPTALITIDSTKVDGAALSALLDILYGTVGDDPSLPSPATVIEMLASAPTLATPTAPTFNPTGHVLTIPTVTGVIYSTNGEDWTPGTNTITEDKFIVARAIPGYYLNPAVDHDWLITYS